MSNKQKTYNSEFKGKVALELIKEEKTFSEICSKYEIHPSIGARWKKEAIDGIKSIFETKEDIRIKQLSEENEKLYTQIGKSKIEIEYLKKKLGM